jgi:hypothetical protein
VIIKEDVTEDNGNRIFSATLKMFDDENLIHEDEEGKTSVSVLMIEKTFIILRTSNFNNFTDFIWYG